MKKISNDILEKLQRKSEILKVYEDVLIYLKELREYKNLEKQGKLLKLPCKVGDIVYIISCGNVSATKIITIKITKNGNLYKAKGISMCGHKYKFFEEHIGTTVFLKKEEAENAINQRFEEM